MPRIELKDSMMDIVIKMSEGNPGAVSVIMQTIKDGEKIDPDAVMGGLMTVLGLDTLGIYGCRIWMLYKDVCRENLNHTIAMLRAVQLGLLGESILKHAIDNRGQGLDVLNMVKEVQERLPNFVVDRDHGFHKD